MGQLRALVQQNPALLQPFLQQLGASNPELLTVRPCSRTSRRRASERASAETDSRTLARPQLIERNQQEFVEFLQEGVEEGEGVDALMDQFGDDEGGAGGAGGEQYIQVTEEERAAIERLVAMGFDRQLVIQAFIACDKNEELAAN